MLKILLHNHEFNSSPHSGQKNITANQNYSFFYQFHLKLIYILFKQLVVTRYNISLMNR